MADSVADFHSEFGNALVASFRPVIFDRNSAIDVRSALAPFFRPLIGRAGHGIAGIQPLRSRPAIVLYLRHPT